MALSLNSLKVYHTLLYAWYASVLAKISPNRYSTQWNKYISGGFVEHELAFLSTLIMRNRVGI